MPKVTINGHELEVAAGTSVLQACEQLGIEVPRFCYHDKLSVPANCRMCLVEVEKTPKPVASCALPCNDGMVVHTDSAMVTKARRGVMEMLLVNHPLDCPICDQGGECDLQDQAMAYGFDRSRYAEKKRAVTDKNFGPLVKTVMTRCIHCTRCIRFVDEIGGTPELGGVFRGEHMEIDTFTDRPLSSELSGNIIDICPVGALTNKPAAFTARPWEYEKTESIDVLDAVGSNIRIDARGNEVLRILPRLNEDVNEEWISDKTRFACDGLMRQRLDRPYVRTQGKLTAVSWPDALSVIAAKLNATTGERMAAIAGDLVDCESMFALKSLMTSMGSNNIDCRQDGNEVDVTSRSHYLMNSGIAGIEKADAVLLIGTNPRHEAAIINARIRKRWLKGGCRVALIGASADLGYPHQHIGTGPDDLAMLLDGTHAFANTLKNAKNPLVIIGAGVFARKDGSALLGLLSDLVEKFSFIRPDWNGFNVLQRAASRVGGLDLGFVPQGTGLSTTRILSAAGKNEIDVIWLLGADELDMRSLGKAFVIYQGHHGDAAAHRADVILPGAAYTEKNGIYVNTEGRPQMGQKAVFPPGQARDDWAILRAASSVIGKPLPFENLLQLREKMFEAVPHLAALGARTPTPWVPFGKKGTPTSDQFTETVTNFYMTDPITRASETMARCTSEIRTTPLAEAAE